MLNLQTQKFRYEHLFSSSKNLEMIKKFKVSKQNGKGLEIYLKENAAKEESLKSNRTYLVKDNHQHVKPSYDEGCIFMYQLI